MNQYHKFSPCSSRLEIYKKVYDPIVSLVRTMVRYNEHIQNLDRIRRDFRDGNFVPFPKTTRKQLDSIYEKLYVK